jgi:ATP-binding cassette subfamily F protein 3
LRTLKFKFPACAKSGREVLRIKDVIHGYGDNILFLGANLLVERGDRIAFLGPNGSGKSTLLRLIMGQEQPLDGAVTHGEHNVIPAYFEQNQSEALDLDKTLLDTIWDTVPQWKTEEVRGLLGRFLFPGDTVFRKVGALSGGEKARLALAKLLLGSANLLVLDEPTNHLDIPAKETVEEALQSFEGSVIIVSHDRYLISAVANKVVEIKNGELKIYHGNYQYYLDRKEAEKQEAQLEQQAAERAAKLAAKREKEKQKKLNKGK